MGSRRREYKYPPPHLGVGVKDKMCTVRDGSSFLQLLGSKPPIKLTMIDWHPEKKNVYSENKG